MKAYDLVLRGGTLVSPQGTIRADVGVAGEKIVAVGLDLSGKHEIDASGKLVIPGVIDAHTHMALPVAGTQSSDDFFTGTRAAACGGVTTIVDFTVGTQETSIPEEIEARKEEAASSVIDYALHGEVVGWHPGNEAEFRDAVKLGIKTFKFYTAYASSGRSSDSGVLYHAFGVLADLDAVALVHCEDDPIIDAILQQMGSEAKGKMTSLAQARPPICEGAAIYQVVYLAEQVGVKVHIVHVSSELGLTAVKRAKARGVRLTAETCPQYLLLTKEVYDRADGHFFSASPALREEGNQQALWQGLSDGALDLVATDHCPFTREQKTWKGSFLDLPYGLPGVETLLPLLYSEGVVKGRMSLPDLPRLLSEGPAHVNGMYPKKGTLSIGSDADVVIFDPNVEWTIHAKNLHMNTDFSPYEGRQVCGAVETTISRGRIVYTNGDFQGEKGWGRFASC